MFLFATNFRPLVTSSFGTCTGVEPDHRTRSRIQYENYIWFDKQYNQEIHTIGMQRHLCLRYGSNAYRTDCCVHKYTDAVAVVKLQWIWAERVMNIKRILSQLSEKVWHAPFS